MHINVCQVGSTHAIKVLLFLCFLRLLPEVIQCYLITGQSADYLLKVVAPDLKAYQGFLLGKLTNIQGVSSVHSSFILRTICDTTALPLDQL